MIHVDRSRLPVPESLLPGGRAERERERAKAFFATRQEGRQSRFDFTAFKSQDVSIALNELFHGKCAYCETRLTSGPADIELFRPKAAVAESPKHPGYWWLASEWENLLISCVDCNRTRLHEGTRSGKANRFPIEDESRRGFDPGSERGEEPLLLDPCGHDDPEKHLVFDWSGLVSSDTPKGHTTISVLGLNRVGLVEARRRAAKEIEVTLKLIPALQAPGDTARTAMLEEVVERLAEMTRDDAEYAGMKRQLLRPELAKLLGRKPSEVFDWDTTKPAVTQVRRSKARKAYRDFEFAQSSFSLATEEGKQVSRSQRRDIQKVSLRNFKGLRDVDFDLEAETGGGGWLMLIGENGVGKSSVLQAIALCLGGANYFATLVQSRGIAPRDLVNAKARKAVVTVRLSGFVDVHTMTVTAEGATFRRPSGALAQVQVDEEGNAKVSGDPEAREVQTVLLGYGATRLLPRGNAKIYGQEFARIDNLFDAFLPLFDADAWLQHTSRRSFNEVALALKDLLSLDADATLARQKGRVVVNSHGSRAPIKRLSDGFQAVVAMSIDILEVAIRLWGTPRNAEGIVLLDEIGAHLHPTWKMRIVSSLRRSFPGMQFIATTHDPLCLRGLTKGEVVVMKRDEDRAIRAISDLPSPSDFRVEQLLTSEFFGLNSTVDPDTEELFDRYYALMALQDPTEDQANELAALKGDMKERRYVGDTLREQLMFEAVDRVIARHRTAAQHVMPQMKQEASEEIARLWDESVTSVLARS